MFNFIKKYFAKPENIEPPKDNINDPLEQLTKAAWDNNPHCYSFYNAGPITNKEGKSVGFLIIPIAYKQKLMF